MHVTLLSCNMWVTSGSYSCGGLHQSGLFCGSVHGSNKGMQVAMIPALISKGMQAMHHDHSIIIKHFLRNSSVIIVVQKRQKTSYLLYNSVNLNETP